MFITKKIKSSTGKITTLIENAPYQSMLEATSKMIESLQESSLKTFRDIYKDKDNQATIMEAYHQDVITAVSKWIPKMESYLKTASSIEHKKLDSIMNTYRVKHSKELIAHESYNDIIVESGVDKYFWSYDNLTKCLQQNTFMETYNVDLLGKLNYPPSKSINVDFVKENLSKLGSIASEYDEFTKTQVSIMNKILENISEVKVNSFDAIANINNMVMECSRIVCKQKSVSEGIHEYETYITTEVLESFLDSIERKLREE